MHLRVEQDRPDFNSGSFAILDSMNVFCIVIQELDIIYRIPHCVPISAHHKWNFDDLLEKIWEYLSLIRV